MVRCAANLAHARRTHFRVPNDVPNANPAIVRIGIIPVVED